MSAQIIPFPRTSCRKIRTADIACQCHGSIWLVRPLSLAGQTWIEDNIASYTTWGGAVAVEPRYLSHLVTGMADDGLSIRHSSG